MQQASRQLEREVSRPAFRCLGLTMLESRLAIAPITALCSRLRVGSFRLTGDDLPASLKGSLVLRLDAAHTCASGQAMFGESTGDSGSRQVLGSYDDTAKLAASVLLANVGPKVNFASPKRSIVSRKRFSLSPKRSIVSRKRFPLRRINRLFPGSGFHFAE